MNTRTKSQEKDFCVAGGSNVWVYDIETYPNCFLVVFKELEQDRQGNILSFRNDSMDQLREFLKAEGLVLIGYNNFGFDDVVLKAILDGKVSTASDIYAFATRILEPSVEGDEEIWKLTHYNRREWGDRTSPWGCIDLFQILGGQRIAGSLKSHEVRLGLPDVKDLPIKPGTMLTTDQVVELLEYCKNDVNATEALYFDLESDVEVRIAVNQRFPYLNTSALRRSNSAIAEAVIKRELETKGGIKTREIRKLEKYIFNPASHIDSAIEFQSPENQRLLKRLKGMPPFDVSEWLSGLNEGYLFHVGGHRIGLGKGGAHTIIPHLVKESENIVGYDVASYYPSLLRRFRRYPTGLTHQWLDILNSLTDERLVAKRSGDKAKAAVYKIIVNSIYGKLEDRFSINQDASLQLAVVLNGQLFLIMLMEAFQAAGHEVISANTDGVYIDAGNSLDSAQKVADQWVSKTGFELERDIATRLVATSVNDYALYAPGRGWYHKKGRFGLGKRTQPAVITEAVLHHFSKGEDPEAFVRNSNNVLDFLYSSSVRGENITEIKHGKATVQRTNRWYRSVNGHPIEKCISSHDGKLKWSKVPNSDSSSVVNTLASYDIPKDLDFDHYINAARNLLQDILANKPPNKVVQSKLINLAKTQHAKGFTIVPKGRPGNEKANVPDTYSEKTIKYWQETPLEDADWSNHLGFGAYTGKRFRLVGIDIDYPEKAKESGLLDLVGKNTSMSWHGHGTPEEILDGKAGGTLLFFYEGEELHTTGYRYLQEYGFELLYGNKVVQLAGNHPSGDDYKVRGKPKKLPKKLLDFLAWTIPESEKTETHEEKEQTTNELNPILAAFQAAANADPEYVKLGGELRIVDGRRGKQLEGLCIGHREHTNRVGDQNMRVYVRGGNARLHCFHQSCGPVREDWARRIRDRLTPKVKVVVKPENVLLKGEAAEIGIALEDPARYKLVIAPTGSGKTHAIVIHVSKSLSANRDGEKFAIICSSKDQMIQLAERFSAVLETDNINQLGIDLIESTKSIRIRDAKSSDAVRDGTRVAITHYTYVSRRKFSQHYYAFLQFIDSNTHVFIDEVDAFVEHQTTHYPLGSRKRNMSKGGIIKKVHVSKCGMFHGYNNCTNCIMHKYDGNRMDVDEYRNIGYIPVAEALEGTQQVALEHIDIDSRVISTVRVGTAEIKMLRQTDSSGSIRFDDDEHAADFKSIFEDHLDSAFLPTVHRGVILYDNEEITRDALIAQYRLNQNMSTSDIPEEERRRLRFPSCACNALTVTTIDRRPIEWMANARSLTALTATLSPTQQRFLCDQLDELKRFDIPPKDDRKMDKIVVVGMKRKIPLKMYQDRHLQFEKMFRYRETMRAAEKDFEELRSGDVPIRMGYDRRKFMLSSDEHDYGRHKILQTYAFSTLGRGVDFASYDLVDINASIYKPISAYVTDDPEELKDQLHQERANTIIQNVGRILRRSESDQRAVKFVVIEQLEEEGELHALVEALSGMSHEPVEFWWAPDFLSDIEVCEHISQAVREKKLPPDLPNNYRVLIDRAEKMISKGEGKTGIKKALRWKTVRKKLTTQEAREVEETIDRLLEVRRDAPEGAVSAKNQKLRERRLRKMEQLRADGCTVAQIRGRMNVRGGNKAWPKSEQEWFEKQIGNNPE